MTDTIAPAADLDAASMRAGANDPAWLRTARAAALVRWNETPVPDRVEHLWRYTDPAKLFPGARTFAVPDTRFGDVPADFADATFEKAAAYAVGRDGALLRNAVDPFLADVGVVVEDVRAAARSRRKLLEPRLFALRGSCGGAGAKFDDLSAAAFTGGAFVHVPRGVNVDRPIRIASRLGAGVFAARSLFIAEEGARATIVIELSSAADGDEAMLHETAEVFVGPSARIRLVFVQTLGRRAVHAPIVRARLERDAALESVTVALGGGTVKSLLTADLAEPGAATHVLGIVFGDGRQHFDHHTFQDHTGPSTSSELDYRTVVAERARSAYTGRLRIGVAAAKAAAHQRNHNLILSDDARADTIPELEILTNDVQCSHAAAVAPIDEEQVYFCTSRGLADDEARRAIVMGFLEPTIGQIPGDALAARVRTALDARLAGALKEPAPR